MSESPRIIIDVTKAELDILREAMAKKYTDLMRYFDDCETQARFNQSKKQMREEKQP